MVSIFRQKSPGTVAILFFFALAVKLPLFLWPKKVLPTANDGKFYQWLLQWLNAADGSAFLCSLLAFFLLYIQALMVNYLVNEYRLMNKATFLPAMAYLLLTSLLPEWSFLSAPLVVTTFVLPIFIILLKLYNTSNARGPLYNMGLLLGLASYFFFPAAAFLLCILLGLVVLKPFRVNEVVLFLIGCLTPYYFMAAILFLKDQLSVASFVPHVSAQVPVIQSTLWLAVSVLLLAVPFLAGGYFVQAHLHKMLIQVRKSWSILLFYLLLAFFIPFVNSNAGFSHWVLLAVPFSCFHASTYHYANKRWIVNLLFVATAGYIFYLQYGTVLWRS